jgi:hypothetical protein
MSDKSWMLSADAISKARMCITVIQDELGVKLKLSHPDFLNMIKEYVELTESSTLRDAYNELVVFAGQPKVHVNDSVVVPLKTPHSTTPAATVPSVLSAEEMVRYKGKEYPKYREGQTFKGLYRGQALYS